MTIASSQGGNVMYKLILGFAAAAALFLGVNTSAQAQHPLHPHHHRHYSGYSNNVNYGRLYISPYSRVQVPVYTSGYGGYGGYGGVGITSYYGRYNAGYGGYNGGYGYNAYRPVIRGGYDGVQLDPYHTYYNYPYPHVHHNHW